jgi:hypothetical protein
MSDKTCQQPVCNFRIWLGRCLPERNAKDVDGWSPGRLQTLRPFPTLRYWSYRALISSRERRVTILSYETHFVRAGGLHL